MDLLNTFSRLGPRSGELNSSLLAPHFGHLNCSPKNFSSRPAAIKSVNPHCRHSLMFDVKLITESACPELLRIGNFTSLRRRRIWEGTGCSERVPIKAHIHDINDSNQRTFLTCVNSEHRKHGVEFFFILLRRSSMERSFFGGSTQRVNRKWYGIHY